VIAGGTRAGVVFSADFTVLADRSAPGHPDPSEADAWAGKQRPENRGRKTEESLLASLEKEASSFPILYRNA
jgi:hypothetical protein